ADFTKADLGGIAFAGLVTVIYLCGIKFFPQRDERLHIVALLGGIGVGVTAVVLSFESSWHMTREMPWGNLSGAGNLGIAVELLCPFARNRHTGAWHSHQQHCSSELWPASHRRDCRQSILR